MNIFKKYIQDKEFWAYIIGIISGVIDICVGVIAIFAGAFIAEDVTNLNILIYPLVLGNMSMFIGGYIVICWCDYLSLFFNEKEDL